MITLKITNRDFKVLCNYIKCLIVIMNKEKEGFIFKKKTVELMQLNAYLHEVKLLSRKLDIKEIQTRETYEKKGKEKQHSFPISPIQSFIFCLYLNRYNERYSNHPGINWTLQQQSDIIHKQLI